MRAVVLLVGAGRMGGALLEGWALAGGPSPREVLILDPAPGAEALRAQAEGAGLNPPPERWAEASVVLLAVKPQLWRAAAASLAGRLSPDAVVVSIAAGVRLCDLEATFQRPAARVMPTTAVRIAKGAACLFSEDPRAKLAARRLFAPLCRLIEAPNEALVDVSTAVSGSSPAYFYLLIEALEAAAVTSGLSPEAAAGLVRATLVGAAALLEASGEEPAELRRQVTSKGGTTEAALAVLTEAGGLPDLVGRAVQRAVARAGELAG